MRSTTEYGELVCLSLLNQLESKERPVISSVMLRICRMCICVEGRGIRPVSFLVLC